MATIQGIYIALFGRPADPLGLEYFNNATNNGADLTAIGDLAATAEYQDRFAGMSNAQVVTAIYQSLFGRNPELAGLEFFVNALNNGDLNINNVAIAILDGAQGDDAEIVANKEAAADLWTAAVAADADALAAYQGETGAAAGRAYLAPVTADEATVPTQAEVDAAVAALSEGTDVITDTFTLTTGNDFADQAGSFRNGTFESDFVFTDGNEVVSATSTTLTAGDILADGSTTDNDQLNISASGAASLTLAAATVSNIENINITAGAAATGNTSFANFTGVQNVTVTGAIAAAGATISAFAASGVTSINTSGVTGGAYTINDNTADQNITVTTGALADSVTLGDGDNTINTGAGADTVVVGDGDNTIDTGAGADNVTVGDGDNTINLGNGANILNAGDGDNTVTSLEAIDTLTLGDGDNVIDSGAGNDIIVVGNGDNVITAGAGADSITLGTGDNVIVIGEDDSGTTTATADSITGFDAGGDNVLSLGTAGSATNYSEFLDAGVASVENAVAAEVAAGVFDGTIQYVFVAGGADGYLLIDSDLDGEADSAVELVGLNALADFAFGNIVA